MARIPSGIVKQFKQQRMLVKELFVDDVQMIANTRENPVRYVHSGNGSASNLGLVPTSPVNSIENALTLCEASAGDVIVCMPGHVETITAAAGLDLDVIGVTVYFLGEGANRAQITFTTAVGADMDIDAASITLVNPLFVAGIDALTGPIDVNAADFTIINGEWRDAAAMGTTDCIVADANADRMRILGWTYVDSTTGTQKQSNIQVAAADDIILRDINIVGDFGTGAIENGTAWLNALLENVVINNTSASPTVGILLQATSTGSMRGVHIRVASGTTYLTANNDMQFFDCWGTGTDATAAENIGTSLSTDIEARLGTESATDPISEILSGTAGITTWKSSAAPATGVSMSEVLRAIYDATAQSGSAGVDVMPSLGRHVVKVGDIATSTDDLFTVTGKCLITLMTGEVTSVLATSTSMSLRTSTNSIQICISTDVVTDVAGTLYFVSGDPDLGLNGATGGVANADIAFSNGGRTEMLMQDDVIVQVVQAAGTGTIQWDLWYIPLEASAAIASAA